MAGSIELNPNYAPLYQWYGEFLAFNIERPQEAVEISRMAVTLDPKSAIINADYAETLDAAGRFEEALAQYRIAAEIDPDFYVAYQPMGYLLERLGRTVEAIESYRKAIELAAEDPWPLFGISAAYLDLGVPERAVEVVARIRDIAPDSVPYNWALALLELRRGNTDKARAAAEQLLRNSPRNRHALMIMRDRDLDRDDAAIARARYLEQLPEIERAGNEEINRRNVETAVDFACLLIQMGDSARAETLLHASLEVMKSTPRLAEYIGHKVADVRAHTLLGNRAGAVAALRDAYDAGWRIDWWLELEADRCLHGLRDEPEFAAIVELIREDMRRQRAILDDESL